MNWLLQSLKVTIYAILIIFSNSQAMAESNPCDQIMDEERQTTCLFYFNDETYPSHLTDERVENCERLYGEWPNTFRMCLRASSRDERMYSEKIRACHRNFYWVYDMRNCLKFAPIINLEDINNCGKRPSDRYRPMKGMTCIGNAAGVWRLDYEEKMFQD